MTSAPLRLTAEDKLDVLRKFDPAGEWQSLDHQSYCTRCDHVIQWPADRGRGRHACTRTAASRVSDTRLCCDSADWTSPVQRNAAARPDDAASHNISTVHIKPGAEGILISHNDRAAVVRRTRSGRAIPLTDFPEIHQLPPQRRRFMTRLARHVASIASNGDRLLGVLRPSARAHYRPIH